MATTPGKSLKDRIRTLFSRRSRNRLIGVFLDEFQQKMEAGQQKHHRYSSCNTPSSNAAQSTSSAVKDFDDACQQSYTFQNTAARRSSSSIFPYPWPPFAPSTPQSSHIPAPTLHQTLNNESSIEYETGHGRGIETTFPSVQSSKLDKNITFKYFPVSDGKNEAPYICTTSGMPFQESKNINLLTTDIESCKQNQILTIEISKRATPSGWSNVLAYADLGSEAHIGQNVGEVSWMTKNDDDQVKEKCTQINMDMDAESRLCGRFLTFHLKDPTSKVVVVRASTTGVDNKGIKGRGSSEVVKGTERGNTNEWMRLDGQNMQAFSIVGSNMFVDINVDAADDMRCYDTNINVDIEERRGDVENMNPGISAVRACAVDNINVEAVRVRACDVDTINVEAVRVRACAVDNINVEAVRVRACDVDNINVEAVRVRACDVDTINVEAVRVRACDVDNNINVEAVRVRACDVKNRNVDMADVISCDGKKSTVEVMMETSCDFKNIHADTSDVRCCNVKTINVDTELRSCDGKNITVHAPMGCSFDENNISVNTSEVRCYDCKNCTILSNINNVKNPPKQPNSPFDARKKHLTFDTKIVELPDNVFNNENDQQGTLTNVGSQSTLMSVSPLSSILDPAKHPETIISGILELPDKIERLEELCIEKTLKSCNINEEGTQDSTVQKSLPPCKDCCPGAATNERCRSDIEGKVDRGLEDVSNGAEGVVNERIGGRFERMVVQIISHGDISLFVGEASGGSGPKACGCSEGKGGEEFLKRGCRLEDGGGSWDQLMDDDENAGDVGVCRKEVHEGQADLFVSLDKTHSSTVSLTLVDGQDMSGLMDGQDMKCLVDSQYMYVLLDDQDLNVLVDGQDLNDILDNQDLNDILDDQNLNDILDDQDLNVLVDGQDLNVLVDGQDMNGLLDDQDKNGLLNGQDMNCLVDGLDKNVLVDGHGMNVLVDGHGMNVLVDGQDMNCLVDGQDKNVLVDGQDMNYLVDECGLVDVYGLAHNICSQAPNGGERSLRSHPKQIERLLKHLEQLKKERQEGRRQLRDVSLAMCALRNEASDLRGALSDICDTSVVVVGENLEAKSLEPTCYKRYTNIKSPADAAKALTFVRNHIKALNDLEVLIYRQHLVLLQVFPNDSHVQTPPPKRLTRPAHKVPKSKRGEQPISGQTQIGNVVIEIVSSVPEPNSWSKEMSQTESPLTISTHVSISNEGTVSSQLLTDTEV